MRPSAAYRYVINLEVIIIRRRISQREIVDTHIVNADTFYEVFITERELLYSYRLLYKSFEAHGQRSRPYDDHLHFTHLSGKP